MKKNFVFRVLLFLSFPAILSSCLEDEEELTGFGDVYAVVESIDGNVVKGLGLHAFSYSAFESVTANLKDEPMVTYALEPYMGFSQDFIWITPSDQFTVDMPASGEYQFNAVFKDGRTLAFYDKLTDDFILPPQITSCTYTSAGNKVDVVWTLVKDADLYNVKLIDDKGKILFVSSLYSNKTSSISFNSSSTGWQNSGLPASGQVITVEVTAYLVEADSNVNDLQCISNARSEIVWGS